MTFLESPLKSHSDHILLYFKNIHSGLLIMFIQFLLDQKPVFFFRGAAEIH